MRNIRAIANLHNVIEITHPTDQIYHSDERISDNREDEVVVEAEEEAERREVFHAIDLMISLVQLGKISVQFSCKFSRLPPPPCCVVFVV